MEAFWKVLIAVFVIAESYALVYRPDDVLSAWVWRWFNVADGWSIERILLLVFLVWLVGHLAWMKWS